MGYLSVSMHASDIRAKDMERQLLSRHVSEFQKNKSITKLPIRTQSKIQKPTFNNAITVIPSKRAVVASDKEAIDIAIRELSHIEIMGVPVRRSATAIAKILRQRGYKLEGTSVQRAAAALGITLEK